MEENTPQIGQNSPDVVGSALFAMKSAEFKKDIKGLTKGDLQHLIRAVCFDGMEKPEHIYTVLTPQLPGLISLAKAFVEAKFVMSMNAAIEAQAKEMQQSETQATEESSNTENGETHS